MQRPEDPKAPKQPFLHRLKNGELFAFAGLWTVAQPKDADEPVASCAVVTTSANRDVAFVNHRMPVVLDGPDAERAWLDPTSTWTPRSSLPRRWPTADGRRPARRLPDQPAGQLEPQRRTRPARARRTRGVNELAEDRRPREIVARCDTSAGPAAPGASARGSSITPSGAPAAPIRRMSTGVITEPVKVEPYVRDRPRLAVGVPA
jgi:hypothetical protein